jgi:hypothetical protein
MSLIIVATTILFTYIFGRDLIERKFPSVITSTGQVLIPPIIELNNRNLPIALGVLDYDYQIPYMDEKAFSIRANMMHG